MQSVLGGSLHKSNTRYLLLGLYHASVNRISIVFMQISPQDERYYGISASSEFKIWGQTECIMGNWKKENGERLGSTPPVQP